MKRLAGLIPPPPEPPPVPATLAEIVAGEATITGIGAWMDAVPMAEWGPDRWAMRDEISLHISAAKVATFGHGRKTAEDYERDPRVPLAFACAAACVAGGLLDPGTLDERRAALAAEREEWARGELAGTNIDLDWEEYADATRRPAEASGAGRAGRPRRHLGAPAPASARGAIPAEFRAGGRPPAEHPRLRRPTDGGRRCAD